MFLFNFTFQPHAPFDYALKPAVSGGIRPLYVSRLNKRGYMGGKKERILSHGSVYLHSKQWDGRRV
jgi:hypothetical protein